MEEASATFHKFDEDQYPGCVFQLKARVSQ